MVNTARIEALWQESQLVLLDCALTNGAIVAANSDLPDYPPKAENYRFVWPRDAAFQIVAAQRLAMPSAADIRSNYLRWLNERGEGFAQTGLLVKRYATNGSLDNRYGRDYQPDQAGALLWALTETRDYPDKLTDHTIRALANGLSSQWGGTAFRTPTQDLWENRTTDPSKGDVFTYSLAAAAYGLGRAIEHWRGRIGEVDAWKKSRESMYGVLRSDRSGPHYLRKILGGAAIGNQDHDNTLDASLDGLVFPFPIPGSEASSRTVATVRAIGRELCALPDGVARYVGDTYDGIVRPDGSEAVAGRWPLLTFWHAIASHKIGQVDEAATLYSATINCLDKKYRDHTLPNNRIPEQLLPGNRQAIVPLAWSHAMFVLATHEFGIL